LDQKIRHTLELIEGLREFHTRAAYDQVQLNGVCDGIVRCYTRAFDEFEGSSFVVSLKKLHKLITDVAFSGLELYKRTANDVYIGLRRAQRIRRQIAQKEQELAQAIDDCNEPGTALFINEIDELQSQLDEITTSESAERVGGADEANARIAENSAFLQAMDRQLNQQLTNLYSREELVRLFDLIKPAYLHIMEPHRAAENERIEREQQRREQDREFLHVVQQLTANLNALDNTAADANERRQEMIRDFQQRAQEISPFYRQLVRMVDFGGHHRLPGGLALQDLEVVDVPLPPNKLAHIKTCTVAEFRGDQDRDLEACTVAEFRGDQDRDLEACTVAEFRGDQDQDLETRSIDLEACSICLQEFKDTDVVRHLECCGQILHRDCVDNWFATKHKCIFCRKDLREVYPCEGCPDCQ